MRPEVEEALGERLAGRGLRVLDVGGVRETSRYSTHLIDIMSYESTKAHWGGYFVDRGIPAENWVVHDICDPKPFPYPDKYFDFAIASHILEDVRDPVRVCRELSRVAKAGFVETPSVYLELTRGVDPRGRRYVGYYHHRWLVRAVDGGLEFLFKPHFLSASRRFHLPPRYLDLLASPENHYVSLFWDGEIRASERVIVVREQMEQEIESIVRGVVGDILPMKLARFRDSAWHAGSNVIRQVGLQQALRPLAGWIGRWF
jgi:SAM-dependent methyltransferase